MKTYFTLLLFFWSTLFLFAQGEFSIQISDGLEYRDDMNLRKNYCIVEDGYVMVHNENENTTNFRNAIRMVKIDTNGNEVWSRKIESTSLDTSIKAEHFIKTFDGNFIISGQKQPNNFPVFSNFILKINNDGQVLWKKYFEGGSSESRIDELHDSTYLFFHYPPNGSLNRLLFTKIDSLGNVVSTFDSNLPSSSKVNQVLPNDDDFTVVIGVQHVVNLSNDLSVVNWEKKYYSEMGLTMNRCDNGDYIFATSQTSFPGHLTVFRTDPNGNVLWANYLESYLGATSSQTTIFDIVGMHSIVEDNMGNIHSFANSEGGIAGSLHTVFDAQGNVLSNQKIFSKENSIQPIDRQHYYVGGLENPILDTRLFSVRHLSDFYECDSVMNYDLSAGSDSAQTITQPLQMIAQTPIATNDLNISVSNASVQISSYCPEQSGSLGFEGEELKEISVFPNPASDRLYIQLDGHYSYQLLDLSGKIILEGFINDAAPIDLGKLTSGVYLIYIKSSSQIFSEKVIVK